MSDWSAGGRGAFGAGFGSLRMGVHCIVPVSSGLRVMCICIRRRLCDGRALSGCQALSCLCSLCLARSADFLVQVDDQVSRGVCQTVARNVLVLKVNSSFFVSHFRDMLVVLESMFAVSVELSPHTPGTV